MAYPKLLSLSDHELTLEVTNAVRHLHATRLDYAARRGSINDDDWEVLYRTLLEAEKYLRFCLAERSRRETAKTFSPKKPRRQRTLVKKDQAPLPAPEPQSAAAPPEPRGWPEPSGPTIIVYDENGPRRWRKGDPIY